MGCAFQHIFPGLRRCNGSDLSEAAAAAVAAAAAAYHPSRLSLMIGKVSCDPVTNDNN